MLDRPAIAMNPKSDKTQIKSKTEEISLKGLGRAPINPNITKKIRMSHKLIVLPNIVKRGMKNASRGP